MGSSGAIHDRAAEPPPIIDAARLAAVEERIAYLLGVEAAKLRPILRAYLRELLAEGDQ
jgi:hypothetical protein